MNESENVVICFTTPLCRLTQISLDGSGKTGKEERMLFSFLNRKRSPSCLAIIGNGFDLAHGLKTSYNDFVRAQDQEIFAEYKYFLEKYCGNVDEWNSFEDRINELTYNCYQQLFSDALEQDEVSHDAETINQIFRNLHKYLLEYLNVVMQTQTTTKKRTISKALRGNVCAISFNYTDTAEIYTKNIFYVHGSLKEKEILLGYDYRDEPCLMGLDMMFWSKSLCRERLAFSRYLRKKNYSPEDEIYRLCMQDIEKVQLLANSGKGFEDEDWETLHNPHVLKDFFANNPHSYSDNFDHIDLSKIKRVVILGHSLSADEHYLSDILRRCTRLKAVHLFTYNGEPVSSLNSKKLFLLPFCKKIVTCHY